MAENSSLFVGKKEVAELLGCSLRQVDVLRQTQGLPCYRLGNLVKFDLKEVEAWAREQAEIKRNKKVKCN